MIDWTKVEEKKKSFNRNLWRVILFAAIVLAIVAVRLSGLGDYLTFQSLKQNADILYGAVHADYLSSVAVFVGIYVLVTGLSLPGAAVMTLAAGFLFGTLAGALYANAGATLGATLAFLVSRYLAGGWLQKRYGEKLAGFNRELERNGYRYLLTLRLIALFPFFLINILAGLTNVPLRTFFWTTAVGIIPGDLVYTFAGSRLKQIENPRDIFSPQVLLAFALLALLPLLPVIIKKLRKSRGGNRAA
jgi:uncharacterized membrane protein YdjX (TVP38/TMEM64 family)